MIVGNRLRAFAGLAAVLLLLPASPAEAHNRRGDRFYKLGQQAEARKDYDRALEYYNRAVHEDPEDPGYQMGVRRCRFEGSQVHVQNGQKLKKDGKFEEALAEFQKAFNMDPSSAVAMQQLRETTDLLDQKKKGVAEPITPVEQARKESVEMIESMLPVPQLKPITNQIPQLKMNNQPAKVLYETVGKLAGINVLFDPSYTAGKNANLDLSNVTLSEALDYIALLTKTYWKPVGPNAIFVTEDNVTKRRDYEDEVVKVFYLKNPTTVQEFQEIVTAVRSVTDVRRMFTYNAQNAIMVRDTVDKVALVEKLLRDMDKPKAEVVVDMIVMEVDSDKSRSIAAGLVSNGTTGLSIPIGYSPVNPIVQNTGTGTGTTGTSSTAGTGGTGTIGITGTTGTGTTGTTGTGTTGSSFVSLGQIGKTSFNDFSASLPGALLQAVMQDTATRVMQSPEVRVSDGQKVELKIGDKIPYASGSFQPGVGTVGVSPLVSTQFQFAETGVNLTVTPHVHGNDEVTLDVTADISNVSQYENLGGLQQPVISQRKTDAHIRVRDGEVSLLGGLMQTQDSTTINGIPGLVNIPILGKYLFGGTSKDKSRQQLMVAIIPHIVRKPDIDALDLRGVAAGQDQEVKIRWAPKKEEPVATTMPGAPTPGGAPAPAATTPGATPPAAAAQTPAPSPATPSRPTAGGASISFAPATIQAGLGRPVVVELVANNVSDLADIPIKLHWDPKILRLNAVTPATLMVKDGNVNPPTLDIRNDSGEASIEISRSKGIAGVSGSGAVIQFTFSSVGKGTANVTVTEMNLRNSKQETINATPPTAVVNVQ